MINYENHTSLGQPIPHWKIISTLALLTIVLGLLGYSEIKPIQPEEDYCSYLFDALYHTLMLFGLSDWAAVNVPLKLQIARWAGLITAGYLIITIILMLVKQEFTFLRLHFIKEHIIICGLNDWSCKLIDSYLSRDSNDSQIIIIESNPQNDKLSLYRQKGVIVIIGQSTDPILLNKAKVQHARYVFAFTEEDESNVDIALTIQQNFFVSIKKKQRNKLTAADDESSKLHIYVHILTPQIYQIFKQHQLFKEADSSINARIFNIYENSARQVFKNYSPDILAPVKAKYTAPPIHVIIIGAGIMGFQLILQFIKQGFYANQEKIHISIIDDNIENTKLILAQQFPEYEEFAQLNFYQEDAQFITAKTVLELHHKQAVDTIYYCLENDFQNIFSSNCLVQQLQKEKSVVAIDIVVCMPENTKLSLSVNNIPPSEWILFSPIRIFNIITESCNWNILVNEELDENAQKMHTEYCKSQINDGKQHDSVKPWSELAEEYRDSNRLKTDYMELRKRAYQANENMNYEDLIELLSIMEHQRWYIEKVFNGWTYGEVRNDQAKVNPLLTQWKNLPEAVKDCNRNDTRTFVENIEKPE